MVKSNPLGSLLRAADERAAELREGQFIAGLADTAAKTGIDAFVEAVAEIQATAPGEQRTWMLDRLVDLVL